MLPLKTAIIGCGQVAGGYDETDSPQGVTTHAHACRGHPGFHLAACVEPDAERRAAFASHWGVEWDFADLEALLGGTEAIDVAIVSCPTESHGNALRRLLDTPVRGVLCEKPLTGNPGESEDLVLAYAEAGKVLAVNYSRRWNKSFARLREEIAASNWGSLRAASCHCSGGLFHSGSHMIDLLHFLFGPMNLEQASGLRTMGHEGPACDALLRADNGAPITYSAIDTPEVGVFELSCYMDGGHFSIEDLGRVLRQRTLEPEPMVPGRRRLGPSRQCETEWRDAMLNCYDEIHGAVTGDGPLASGGQSALAAERMCAQILDLAGETGGHHS